MLENDFHSGEALCREVTLLCSKDIELHAAYLIHTCTMNYIAAPTKNVSTLELKKKRFDWIFDSQEKQRQKSITSSFGILQKGIQFKYDKTGLSKFIWRPM